MQKPLRNLSNSDPTPVRQGSFRSLAIFILPIADSGVRTFHVQA
jgi:hypothetical protein